MWAKPHWAERYLGTAWSRERDCAWLVETVLREQFGHDDARVPSLDWQSTRVDDVITLARSHAVETDAPRDGDGVLMRLIGNDRDLGHIGVCAIVQGTRWVLHSAEGFGVRFVPVARLRQQLYEVVGYYRWTGA